MVASTGRCRRPSIGPTTCSSRASVRCSIGCRCSPAASPPTPLAVICGDDGADEVDVAIVLDGLVARSVVDADPARTRTRYSLLETLRQFGEDRLLASGDTEALRARHARYFLELAGDARRRLSTPQAGDAMTVFVDEWDNLRVAFDWLASSGDVDGALRLVLAAYWFAVLAGQNELLPGGACIVLDGARDHSLWSAAAGATAVIRSFTGYLVGVDTLASEALHEEEHVGHPLASNRFGPWVMLAGSRERRTSPSKLSRRLSGSPSVIKTPCSWLERDSSAGSPTKRRPLALVASPTTRCATPKRVEIPTSLPSPT